MFPYPEALRILYDRTPGPSGLGRWLALLVLLCGLWLALPPTRSWACSCPSPGAPLAEQAKVAVVFRGKAVSVREFPAYFGSRGGAGIPRP